jgi:hypothetical protein
MGLFSEFNLILGVPPYNKEAVHCTYSSNTLSAIQAFVAFVTILTRFTQTFKIIIILPQ